VSGPCGRRRVGLDAGEQDGPPGRSRVFAAEALQPCDAVVLLEPLSGMPAYPLKTAADAFDVIDRLATEHGVHNVGFLLDQYHLMSNGEDVVSLVRSHGGRVDHVQIADVPGRGEPGSGDSQQVIAEMIAGLASTGYAGALALEYLPTSSTRESLEAWHSTGLADASL